MGGLLATHQEKTGKDDDLKSMNHQHTYANFTMLLKKASSKEIPTKPNDSRDKKYVLAVTCTPLTNMQFNTPELQIRLHRTDD